MPADGASVAPPAWEVVRTLDLAFLPRPEARRAFHASYRADAPLDPAHLNLAAAWYSWYRLHDVWLCEALYRDWNERVGRFVPPGHFVTFAERWRSLVRAIYSATSEDGRQRGIVIRRGKGQNRGRPRHSGAAARSARGRCAADSRAETIRAQTSEEFPMRNPILRFGLIFGAIVIVVRALQAAANVAVLQSMGPLPDPVTNRSAYISQVTTLGLITGGISFAVLIIDVALYLLAGRSSAAQTGAVGTGALTGLVAGAFAGVVGAIIAISLYLSGVTTSVSAGATTTVSPATLQALAIGGEVFHAALEAGIGASIGALGGLMGKSVYEKAHPISTPGAYPPPGAFPQQPLQ